MSRRKTPAPVKRRNPLHDAPLMRKCEIHGRSKKAQRRKDKVAVKKEWFSPRGPINATIEKIIQAINVDTDHGNTLSRVPARSIA